MSHLAVHGKQLYAVPRYQSGLYVSRDSGGTWGVVAAFKGKYVRAIATRGAVAWAAVASGNLGSGAPCKDGAVKASYHLYRTADGGKTWKRKSQVEHHVRKIVATSGGFYAATASGLARLTAAKGVRLLFGKRQKSPPGAFSFSGCVKAEPDAYVRTLVAGPKYLYVRLCGQQWKSSGDGGRTWKVLRERPTTACWLRSCDGNGAFVGAAANGQGLWGAMTNMVRQGRGIFLLDQATGRWKRHSNGLGKRWTHKLLVAHGGHLYTHAPDSRAPMRYDSLPFGTGAPSRGPYTALVAGGGYLWAATLKGIWRCRLPAK